MKLFKDLGKEIFLQLLLTVGICLLFSSYFSLHQSFSHRNQKWKMRESSMRHGDTGIVSFSSSESILDLEDTRDIATIDMEQQPDQKDNSVPAQASIELETQNPDDDIDETDEIEDGIGGETLPSKPVCDFSDLRSNVCNMTGDIRAKGFNSSTIFFIPSVPTLVPREQEWVINPYSQKMYAYIIKYVTVKQLHDPRNVPVCNVLKNIPAIVLSTGGPSAKGNIWHAFNDVLIPLFLASKPFNREVQFLVSSYNGGLIKKHRLILKNLTRYKIINFDESKEIRCYPHMMVGLLNHRDFSIDPDRAFNRFDMFKFRLYVRSIYSLPTNVNIPYKMNSRPDKKPRLMLMLRSNNRKLLNQKEVAAAIRKKGFEVILMEPKKSDKQTYVSKLIDSCDVLLGIHGAGLTNMLFLRTNAVMIQVIPFGGSHMINAAHMYLQQPAKDMKLRTLEYKITVKESSLLDKYGRAHIAVRDPEAVAATGWEDRQRYYWMEQDVRLNVTRFEPVLAKALKLIKKK